jgi:hypothetical protein
VTSGANLLEQLKPFPAHAVFERSKAGRIAARSCQARDKPSADWISDLDEHDRQRARRLQQRCHHARAIGDDEVGRKRDHLANVLAHAFDTLGTQAIVDAQVVAHGPAQCLQSLQQCREARLPFRIVRGQRGEQADAPHTAGLLRARRERPRCSRAAEQRDELAPLAVQHRGLPPLCVRRRLAVRQSSAPPACRRAARKSLGQT